MNTTQASKIFSAYTRQEQIDFLSLLAFELTIIARDTYEAGQEGLTNPARLRRINEVQHSITGQLLNLLKNDPHRYPDDALMQIILEQPDDAELQGHLELAFNHSVNLMPVTV